MIRVLHVIRAMNRAGAETFIMNAYRYIDRSQIQFDFLLNVSEKCDYSEEILDLGGRIFFIPRYYGVNFYPYAKNCRNFFGQHPECQIVHGHIGSSAPIYLPIAKKAGLYTIAHSHNAMKNDSLSNILFNTIARGVRGKADYYLACSKEAGMSRFGKSICESPVFSIVNNGIDSALYYRNESSVKKAKCAFGVENSPVFLHIGRFNKQKNHEFLIRVFSEVQNVIPNALLLLAGNGEELNKIRQLVNQLSLSNNIRFLGIRSDIPELLRASDVFLFPSLSEGLGIAFIEAQTSGLPCVVSKGIPDQACIAPNVVKLDLKSTESWAKAAIDCLDKSQSSIHDNIPLTKRKGFDIKTTVDWLTAFYLKHAYNISC